MREIKVASVVTGEQAKAMTANIREQWDREREERARLYELQRKARRRADRIDAARFIVAVVGTVTVVVSTLGLAGRQVSHWHGRNACAAWGEATGREVKWVDLTFWQYGCLTPTDDGRWVWTSQVIKVEQDEPR
jgi:predicted Zn-dependent protease